MDEGPTTSSGDAPVPALSKKQQKKLAKMEKKIEKRKVKRVEERQRRKENRKALRESGQNELLKKPKFTEMSLSKCPINVVVDMSYQQLMNESLIRKTIAQLNYCYGANRRADNPLQYHIANLNGLTKQIFDGFPGYAEWDVFTHEESVAEIWNTKNVVYLTSDSDNVLLQLDPKKIYVIGGLLDHNSHPGVSFAKAKQHGFGHARLPIGEYCKLNSRKVLTINHVFEIILRYWETNDWEKAFFSVIPKRKGLEKLKSTPVLPVMPETQGTQTQQTIQLDTQVGDNQRVFQFDLPESDNVIG